MLEYGGQFIDGIDCAALWKWSLKNSRCCVLVRQYSYRY